MSLVGRSRKVGTSELTKVVNGCSVVHSRALFGPSGRTEIDVLSAYAESSHPISSICSPPNTLESGGVVDWLLSISRILFYGCWAKIGASIVEGIAALMVYVNYVTNYLAVHWNSNFLSVRIFLPYGDIHSGSIVQLCVPVIAGNVIPNQGVNLSELALGKGNESDILVMRRDDGVSLHAMFHREPPFLVRLSAASLHSNMLEAM